jgi:type I restriction enzyme S subunit
MEKVLPKGWVETELGLGLTINMGQSPSSSTYNSDGIGMPFMQGKTEFGKIFPTIVKFTTKPTKIVEKNTVLLSVRAPIGPTNVSTVKMCIGRGLAGITSPIISSKFILYYIRSIEDVLDSLGTGTTFKAISGATLNNALFLIPPLAEQERIVAKLDKLFAQHEKIKAALDRIPKLLKNFRQQLLTQAVTGKLNKVSVLENKLVSDFFEVKTGATPKKGVSKYYQDATIPWIKSGEVKNTFIHDVDEFISEIAVKETNAKVFPIDTILVAMYGEGKTRGQVGWMKIEAATNQAIAALVNENLNEWTRRYIYLFCLSQYNEIRAKAEGGNQPNLNLSKIKNWEISIPQKASEQQEIVLRVESLFAKADAIEARYLKLKANIESLPQALLHKAFKGELVPQLPTDGNAKKLLAEILALKKESKEKRGKQ